ncbi:MAG: 50S ribosomal protein L25/general stress protein Ctc [Albimonas sp.]|mgnify:FL=1|uniref:50S ribosomal protein L25/general stress protein Ctc n=1 Tax=Albimonas sp. TaxID=1872425 RepID=UPI0040559E7C|tara:strand:- start:185 stop:808 length:624 start_codon:yes stop_codon:yes gene_type:complete
MADLPVLEATARSGTGKGAARAARREGLVPGVIYGGGQDPVTINVKHNELLKRLKAGRFLSTLFNVKVDGADTRVICRAVQRDVVRDLPTHVDFLRLTEKSRINLFVHVDFVNQEASPGLKKGGVLTVVRSEVELNVIAGAIPDHITVDLTGKNFGDVIHISDVELPKGVTPTIKDRDFVIANISAPSGLRAAEAEEAEAEEAPAEE